MDEQQLQQQIVQLVQMAMQGDQQATKLIEQIMQAAQQGDQQAMQLAQMIQQVAQQLQSQQQEQEQEQVRAAKFGAKLDYIKQLRGQCPEGYEMQYYKQGGQLCKKCMKKAQEGTKVQTPKNAVDAFKCGRKMKKNKCGGNVDKKQNGGQMEDGLEQMGRAAISGPGMMRLARAGGVGRFINNEVLLNRPGSERNPIQLRGITVTPNGSYPTPAYENQNGRQRVTVTPYPDPEGSLGWGILVTARRNQPQPRR